jgi:uncharacterized protein (TIGR02996 family)
VRFERLGHTPVAVRELDVVDASVITRDGDGVVTKAFASPEAAREHADALTAAWRADGYIPIKRVPPAAPEEPLSRNQRFEWRDKAERCFREIFQRNDAVRIVDGRIVDGDDVRTGPPEVVTHDKQKHASAEYERWIARTDRDIAEAGRRTKTYEAELALRAEKGVLRKKRQQQERFGKNVHAELERECRASPDAVGPWQVYADWLIEHDDDVGEVAALALGGDSQGAVFRALALLDAPDDAKVEVELRHGFIRQLTLRPGDAPLADLIRQLLVSPACRFLESLRLGLATRAGYENDWAPSLAVITDSFQAPQLRELRLDAYDANDSEISWVPYGDLAFAWPKLPALELLHVRAGGTGNLGTLDIPRLRTFIRETGGLSREDLRSICRLPHPALEHLELWTGTVNAGGEIAIEDLAPILDAQHFPALRHLGIVNSELSDLIIPALVASRVLPQLHSLDLSMGIFARTATTLLVEHARHFRHLASFDLSDNVLTPEEIAELRDVLDNIITNAQREREDDFPDDPGVRYVAVGE